MFSIPSLKENKIHVRGVWIELVTDYHVGQADKLSIMLHVTRPCYSDPLTPHFYVVKLGCTGVYTSLIFAQSINLWVLVIEPPHYKFVATRYNRLIEADLTCSHKLCLEQKLEKSTLYQFVSSENYHFYSREISQYIA